MTLPERDFRNPVARAIIEQRRELATESAFATAGRRDPRRSPLAPALYRDDTVVFLALSLAQERLRVNDDAAHRAESSSCCGIPRCVSRTAASVAERELRRLQQELQDALAQNAPDEEIDRLMNEMQQALDRYLQSLAQNMARNPDQTSSRADPSRMLTAAIFNACSTAPATSPIAARTIRRASCCRSYRTCWKICAWRGRARRRRSPPRRSR